MFLLIFSLWAPAVLTLGQVWPFDNTPRKTVTLNSNRGHVFQEEGVWNYTTMLLREDMGVLILGARQIIFALNLSNITHKKAKVKWEVTNSESLFCSYKGKNLETECHNYIRILHNMSDGRMYVCGTYAFSPRCDYMSYTDGNLTLEGKQDVGKGRCPYDPFQRYASEFVDGELYSATSNNFLGSEPIVMRSLKDTIRSDFRGSWLNVPNFIGMKHVAEGEESPDGEDDKIYLFFSETSVEYASYNEVEVSRVARVCKGDLGGLRTLQKKWSSFQKAQLDCPVPQTKLPFLIQDVFLSCPGNWTTCVFYGVFTPQTEMMQYSAVCTYSIHDIRKVFSEGRFKTRSNDMSTTIWVAYNEELPDPRPGTCINNDLRARGYNTSLDLPYKTLKFIGENPLMDPLVKPLSDQPLLVKKGAAFTRIVVASTTALDGSRHQVMFIGTTSGSVLKAVNYNGKTVIIEEVQLFKQSDPVKVLRVSTTTGQLYAGSEEAVVQMPLSTCDRYTSCIDCVLARDPYCGWNLISKSCIAIRNIHQDAHSEVVQSLMDGDATRCPAVVGTKISKIFYPGNTVNLSCQPGSNLAHVQWHVNDHKIENSSKYHIHRNSLIILNALDSDTGHYTCTSVESSNGKDYVTQITEYELKEDITLMVFKILFSIVTPMLLVVVIWNFYKGHFALPRCMNRTEDRPSSASDCTEPLQIVDINMLALKECSSNRNNHHNMIT